MSKNQLSQALIWIDSILKRKNIPYQITGGFAAYIYGATRKINDIDIDLPEDKFKSIISDIKPYITYGPDHYHDEKWDLQLITLNYKEQEIDLGGAFNTKIYNNSIKSWQNIPANLENVKIMKVFDILVPVINPDDLVYYKSLLNGDHQMEDIEAVKQFTKNNQ